MSKQANILWVILASVATGVFLTMAGYSLMDWIMGNALDQKVMVASSTATGAAICGASATTAAMNVKDAHFAGVPTYWLVFGLIGQFAFTMRFVVQWLSSEKAGKVVIPKAFWFLSLGGSAILLVYFLRRGDPVGVIGQSFVIY